MKGDSPAATSCGSGRVSGCDGSVMGGAMVTPEASLADVVVLRGTLEILPRDQRTDRRIELRKGAIERAVLNVAAHAGIVGRHEVACGVCGAEGVERVAIVGRRVADHVDLVVGEV